VIQKETSGPRDSLVALYNTEFIRMSQSLVIQLPDNMTGTLICIVSANSCSHYYNY